MKHNNRGITTASKPSRPPIVDERWTVLGVCIFLAAIVWVVFGQTLRYGFVNFDDNAYVYENPEVIPGLTFQGIVWAFTHVHSFNWHPLTWISHMLDCQFYGLNPGGHHLTNILLHITTTLLLFLILRQMTGALWRSAFVAAVFAVHPLRLESVAWVAERKDVLSGVFFMLTIGAYVRYARLPWSPARYGLVVLLFALGLMCKPMLVTLPFVLLALDYWPLNRFQAQVELQPVFRLAECRVPKRLIFEKLPLLGLAAMSCVATLAAQRQAIWSFEQIPLLSRVGNAFISYVTYVGQMFWPSGLAVLYPFPANGGPLLGKILALVFLLSTSACAFVLRKTRPYLLTGWFWYLIMLVPVIGILQVGSQAHADRYTYLPQIGLYLMLTWAADLSVRWRHRRLVFSIASAVILVAFVCKARVQAAYWRNSESLWTHTLACTSENFIARNNLGIALLEKGNLDGAIAQYEQALKIRPGYADAHSNLGNALLQKGDVDGAMAQCEQALQINPNNAEAHNNLGNALLQKGRVDEALVQCQEALRIKPDSAETHNNLGNALLQKGELAGAVVQFETALQLKPDGAEADYNLGNALLQMGHMDEAMAHYRHALQVRPGYVEAHNNLGGALLREGKVDEAITHFQSALAGKPDYADAHFNLGNALLQLGKLDGAIAQYRQALQIEPGNLDTLNNLAWVLTTAPDKSLRNGPQAVELARQADQLAGGKSTTILRTLAAACAEAGQFGDAVQSARTAIALAQTAGQSNLEAQLNVELKLYEAGLPFRAEAK